MARKSSARSNYIKIGWIALVVVILFGIVATITDTFVPGFDAVPFILPIPLDTASKLNLDGFERLDFNSDGTCSGTINTSGQCQTPNSLVECRIWTEGTIRTDGGDFLPPVITTLPFITEIFDPDIRGLTLLDLRTGEEIERVEMDLRMRCQEREGAFGGTSPTFDLIGGTLTTQWTAVDGDGSVKQITPLVTTTLPSGNILFDPSSAGLLLASFRLTGDEIDSKLTSTREVYTTSPKVSISVKPDFNFKLPILFIDDTSRDVSVNLESSIGIVKVFNSVLDPPTPSNQNVVLKVLNTNPDPLKDTDAGARLEIRVQLPGFETGEPSPTFSVARPTASASTLIDVARNIPLTANKDVGGGTIEFFTTNYILNPDPSTKVGQDGLLQAGQWFVEVESGSRIGSDSGTFTVFSDSQPDPNKKETEAGTTGGTTQQQQQQQQQQEEEEEERGIPNILNFADLLDCFERTDTGTCLNDSKFIPIYGILVVIILLAVVTGRR